MSQCWFIDKIIENTQLNLENIEGQNISTSTTEFRRKTSKIKILIL